MCVSIRIYSFKNKRERVQQQHPDDVVPRLFLRCISIAYYHHPRLRIINKVYKKQRTGVDSGVTIDVLASVGKGVMGGSVGSGGRVTPGVGASVLSVPASMSAANAIMNAMDDFMFIE